MLHCNILEIKLVNPECDARRKGKLKIDQMGHEGYNCHLAKRIWKFESKKMVGQNRNNKS